MSEPQETFVSNVAQLIVFAYARGDRFTFGDAWAKEGHVSHSLHYERLAIDLNLFIDGKWIVEDHEEWRALGDFWKTLDPRCRWGGDIVGKVDLNHVSMVPNAGDDRI